MISGDDIELTLDFLGLELGGILLIDLFTI
jgi:hypothetical protein